MGAQEPSPAAEADVKRVANDNIEWRLRWDPCTTVAHRAWLRVTDSVWRKVNPLRRMEFRRVS